MTSIKHREKNSSSPSASNAIAIYSGLDCAHCDRRRGDHPDRHIPDRLHHLLPLLSQEPERCREQQRSSVCLMHMRYAIAFYSTRSAALDSTRLDSAGGQHLLPAILK